MNREREIMGGSFFHSETPLNVEMFYSWEKTFVIMPRKTIKDSWAWGRCYRRSVDTYKHDSSTIIDQWPNMPMSEMTRTVTHREYVTTMEMAFMQITGEVDC